MTAIDWSKVHPQQRKDIPALTTHFTVGTHDHSFVKMPDRYIWSPHYKCWNPMSKSDYQDWYFDRLIPIEQYESLIPNQWQGAGLPPVGTVCEYYADEDSWQRCEIVAHKDGQAVVWVSNAHIWASSGASLRPIRTPEQIAAEEREKAIDQIMADYEFTVGSCTHKLFRHQAERLHAAGYRKVDP